MAGAVSVTCNVGSSATVPARITVAEKKMQIMTAEGMARAVGVASRSRQIAAATHPLSISGNVAIIGIGIGVPFAKLRDRGGYTVPKQAKVLRFADGEFRPSRRVAGLNYVAEGERAFGQVAELSFHGSFDTL